MVPPFLQKQMTGSSRRSGYPDRFTVAFERDLLPGQTLLIFGLT